MKTRVGIAFRGVWTKVSVPVLGNREKTVNNLCLLRPAVTKLGV